MSARAIHLACDLPLRQRQILELIAAGETTKAIALHLAISPKTVEFHRIQLMNALHIHDIPNLIKAAIRLGLVPGFIVEPRPFSSLTNDKVSGGGDQKGNP